MVLNSAAIVEAPRRDGKRASQKTVPIEREGVLAKDRRVNSCRDSKVAITLRVMIANKNWKVIDSPIPTNERRRQNT